MADLPVPGHEDEKPEQGPTAASTPQPESSSTLEELVWHELRELYDPEIPVNIVELGLIYAMRTAPLAGGGHRVEVLMTVTSPACGMSEVLRTEADARLRSLPEVREVEVAVTFDPPWTPSLMSEEARLLLNL
jgi:metal-sulfur cluster biosynthetic enzyme